MTQINFFIIMLFKEQNHAKICYCVMFCCNIITVIFVHGDTFVHNIFNHNSEVVIHTSNCRIACSCSSNNWRFISSITCTSCCLPLSWSSINCSLYLLPVRIHTPTLDYTFKVKFNMGKSPAPSWVFAVL